MNNFEKIKAMSIEEMAEYLIPDRFCYNCPVLRKCNCGQTSSKSCFQQIKQWLESESEE